MMRKKALILLIIWTILTGTITGIEPVLVVHAQSNGEETVSSENDGESDGDIIIEDDEDNADDGNNADNTDDSKGHADDEVNNKNNAGENNAGENNAGENNEDENGQGVNGDDEGEDGDDENDEDEDDEDDYDKMTEEEKEAFRKQREEATTLENGSLSLSNCYVKWTSGTNAVISGDYLSMELTPINNVLKEASCEVSFTLGGSEAVPTNGAEIRLPRYIFYKRNGTPSAESKTSIPLKPKTGGSTSFHYYIDDKGDDDPANDEIVITNYEPLPAGGLYFRCNIMWYYYPYEIKNGYVKDDIGAAFSVQGDNGTIAEKEAENKIAVTVNTSPAIASVSKAGYAKKESWQAEWGAKPADADQYFYVVWTVGCIMSQNSTSPYKVYFED